MGSFNKRRLVDLVDSVTSPDLVAVVAKSGEWWPDLMIHGEVLLQIGVSYMAAFFRCHDTWLKQQPLQMPMTAPTQPPRQRPSDGFPMACIALPLPSGVVPGEEKDGRRFCPCCCGGEEGPACFAGHSLWVLYVNLQDYDVIFSFSGSCTKCNPTADESMQL